MGHTPLGRLWDLGRLAGFRASQDDRYVEIEMPIWASRKFREVLARDLLGHFTARGAHGEITDGFRSVPLKRHGDGVLYARSHVRSSQSGVRRET